MDEYNENVETQDLATTDSEETTVGLGTIAGVSIIGGMIGSLIIAGGKKAYRFAKSKIENHKKPAPKSDSEPIEVEAEVIEDKK